MDLTTMSSKRLDTFSAIERAGSILSILGSVFIITTFCSSRAFHKPIHRLIFYATFGNLMTNVATLMARTYVGDTISAGCQLQAFLIQMFMPADTFWALAMATNVYLTFYHKFDAQKLRRMEIPYLILCYGIPFIVAITLVFISSPQKGRMYGDATLWCWISAPWDIFRIAAFYAPVWIVILLTFFIYIRAGGQIYKKHRQLRNLDLSSSHYEPEPQPPSLPPFSSSKTTEVFVTSEAVDTNAIDLAPLGRRDAEAAPGPRVPNAAYSVTISSNRRTADADSYNDIVLPTQSNTSGQSAPVVQRPPPANRARRRAAYDANSAAWSYAKCAILFFTAMLVTWIPSSANRVYSVVHKGEVSVPLQYMSALVLPLQGFWNGLIYIVTAWKACQMLWRDTWHRSGSKRAPKELAGGIQGRNNSFAKMGSGRNRSKSSDKSAYESESMTELAVQSRPSSQENSKGRQ